MNKQSHPFEAVLINPSQPRTSSGHDIDKGLWVIWVSNNYTYRLNFITDCDFLRPHEPFFFLHSPTLFPCDTLGY